MPSLIGHTNASFLPAVSVNPPLMLLLTLLQTIHILSNLGVHVLVSAPFGPSASSALTLATDPYGGEWGARASVYHAHIIQENHLPCGTRSLYRFVITHSVFVTSS